MYGLPSDPKIDLMKGETLNQVCIGANDLILHFSGDVSIAIISSIGLAQTHQAIVHYSDFKAASSELVKFLTAVVTDVSWDPNGTITLTCGEGSVIEFYDDSEHYESYTITKPGGLIVV